MAKKSKGTITWPCPDCEVNDQFKVLEIVISAKEASARAGRQVSGQYRCECTACGYTTIITSRNPMNYREH